jgi:hypothetical protein
MEHPHFIIPDLFAGTGDNALAPDRSHSTAEQIQPCTSRESLPTDSTAADGRRNLNTAAARRSRKRKREKLEKLEERLKKSEDEYDRWKKLAMSDDANKQLEAEYQNDVKMLREDFQQLKAEYQNDLKMLKAEAEDIKKHLEEKYLEKLKEEVHKIKGKAAEYRHKLEEEAERYRCNCDRRIIELENEVATERRRNMWDQRPPSIVPRQPPSMPFSPARRSPYENILPPPPELPPLPAFPSARASSDYVSNTSTASK